MVNFFRSGRVAGKRLARLVYRLRKTFATNSRLIPKVFRRVPRADSAAYWRSQTAAEDQKQASRLRRIARSPSP